MTLIDILLAILILAATALCIFLIFSIKKIGGQLEELQKDVKHLVENTVPVLKNLNEVTQRANRIVTSAENYWDEIERSIQNLKERVSKLTSYTKFSDAENPAGSLIKNLKAVLKGISTFWSEFRRR